MTAYRVQARHATRRRPQESVRRTLRAIGVGVGFLLSLTVAYVWFGH